MTAFLLWGMTRLAADVPAAVLCVLPLPVETEQPHGKGAAVLGDITRPGAADAGRPSGDPSLGPGGRFAIRVDQRTPQDIGHTEMTVVTGLDLSQSHHVRILLNGHGETQFKMSYRDLPDGVAVLGYKPFYRSWYWVKTSPKMRARCLASARP